MNEPGTYLGDPIEEAKLDVLEGQELEERRQLFSAARTCPYRRGHEDSVDTCDENENRPCVYELCNMPGAGCEVFRSILKEWREL